MRRGQAIAMGDQGGKGIGYDEIITDKREVNEMCVPQVSAGVPLLLFDPVSSVTVHTQSKILYAYQKNEVGLCILNRCLCYHIKGNESVA